MGAVLSAVHFGDQYLRSRGARHSDVYLRLWDGAVVDHVWMISGPWNIMNAIAGILNIITICGWFGIFISKDKSRDMIWPDMLWMWIIAYDLWNFAYTYNCMSDHSTYTGLALLIACTVPNVLHEAWCMVAASRANPGALCDVRHGAPAVLYVCGNSHDA